MRAQNETFRRLGRGPFGDLVRAMLRDPALLEWLDAPSNRPGKPNENLGRELMELFTLRAGHYTENDVKNAARALTGLSVVQGRFQNRQQDHDAGDKTVLGKTARFDADSLADHLLSQPAAAKRLALRLCGSLLGEGVVNSAAKRELAGRLRADNLHISHGIETILRSELFFSQRNLHARVSDPVGYVVGAVRALERFDPPPSTLLLAEWTTRLGQDLFYPPNVGGWPGGRGWLSERAVVARANFAAALAAGRLNSDATPPDLAALARRRSRASGARAILQFFAELLTGRPLDHTALDSIWKSIKSGCPALVYYVIQSGYDTHAIQLPIHARLLREFTGAIRAFFDDLGAAKLADLPGRSTSGASTRHYSALGLACPRTKFSESTSERWSWSRQLDSQQRHRRPRQHEPNSEWALVDSRPSRRVQKRQLRRT
jgi:hypothetical protein